MGCSWEMGSTCMLVTKFKRVCIHSCSKKAKVLFCVKLFLVLFVWNVQRNTFRFVGLRANLALLFFVDCSELNVCSFHLLRMIICLNLNVPWVHSMCSYQKGINSMDVILSACWRIRTSCCCPGRMRDYERRLSLNDPESKHAWYISAFFILISSTYP